MLEPGAYTREDIEAIGNVAHLYADIADREAVLAIARRDGFVRDHEVCFKRKDGSAYESLLSLQPIRIDGKQGWLATAKDISGRKQEEAERTELEHKLQEGQHLESLGRLAGGVAHDFNNLLQAIVANLSLAHRKAPDEIRPYHEQALEAVSRAKTLVSQLLAYGRQAALDVQPVRVDTLVDEVAAMLRETVDRSIELVAVHRGEGLVVEADRGQLYQVVLNLALNARDALALLDEDGRARRIELRTSRDQTHVCVAVIDNGVGMDAQTRSRAFEPFFTTKEVGGGTGLGLASVQGILAQHDGWIEVESAPQEGTTVRCFLPHIEAIVPPVPSPVRPAEGGGTETLLLVDDEAMVREVMGELLELSGYRVLTASDGESALAMFAEHHDGIDAILLDLSMPGIPGAIVLDRLREVDPNVRVIVCSGYAMEGNLKLDADMLLQKPIQEPELLDALDRLFGRKPG